MTNLFRIVFALKVRIPPNKKLILRSMHSIFMNSEAVSVRVKNTGIRRMTHWPTKRVTHALLNLGKLRRAFTRCGSEADSYSQISKLSIDVCGASDEILAAFSQWTKTHLSACKNNQVHTERMDTKWSKIYNEVLGCAENQSETQPVTQSTTQSRVRNHLKNRARLIVRFSCTKSRFILNRARFSCT